MSNTETQIRYFTEKNTISYLLSSPIPSLLSTMGSGYCYPRVSVTVCSNLLWNLKNVNAIYCILQFPDAFKSTTTLLKLSCFLAFTALFASIYSISRFPNFLFSHYAPIYDECKKKFTANGYENAIMEQCKMCRKGSVFTLNLRCNFFLVVIYLKRQSISGLQKRKQTHLYNNNNSPQFHCGGFV